MAPRLTIASVFPGKGKRAVATETRHAPTGSFGLVTDARKDAERVEIELSYPPATNNLYFNVPGKGRVRSDRYNQWLDESAWLLLAQKPGRVSGKFIAEITVNRPDNRRRDLDGLLKPLLDCCVKNRIVSDDSLAERITLAWANGGEGVRVVLTKAEGQP
jgi:Holliday junction resolvase RusA-like endonuclease